MLLPFWGIVINERVSVCSLTITLANLLCSFLACGSALQNSIQHSDWPTTKRTPSYPALKKITTWPYSMKFNRNLPCRTLYKNTRRPKNNLQQQQQYNDRLPSLPSKIRLFHQNLFKNKTKSPTSTLIIFRFFNNCYLYTICDCCIYKLYIYMSHPHAKGRKSIFIIDHHI